MFQRSCIFLAFLFPRLPQPIHLHKFWTIDKIDDKEISQCKSHYISIESLIMYQSQIQVVDLCTSWTYKISYFLKEEKELPPTVLNNPFFSLKWTSKKYWTIHNLKGKFHSMMCLKLTTLESKEDVSCDHLCCYLLACFTHLKFCPL
jgi:hypothetical protein